MTDFLPGEIMRLKVDSKGPSWFGPAPAVESPRFTFVRFLGVFAGQAVVENANGERQMVPFSDVSHIPFLEEAS